MAFTVFKTFKTIIIFIICPAISANKGENCANFAYLKEKKKANSYLIVFPQYLNADYVAVKRKKKRGKHIKHIRKSKF